MFALLLFSACTDYVSKIDGQISELKAFQDEDSTEQSNDSRDESGDEITKSSSSSKKVESSSSVAPSSSSWNGGYMTDSRDGQVYKTVKISSQTWMAENLNYKTAESYCYDDKSANCEKYGRLYTWAAAMEACPSGWHLPTVDEFESLLNVVGGKTTAGPKLKSKTGWKENGNGMDSYSFASLPAGIRNSNGKYRGEGAQADFWSSNAVYYIEDGSIADDARGLGMMYDGKSAFVFTDNRFNGNSVRCLKD